jgi:diaminopimelate epimerase
MGIGGLEFHKYEGLGNDFILIDGGRSVTVDRAKVLCDRHLGVGADGVLLVTVEDGRASMRVINADGSTPEMCGNGLRCVALHLHRTGQVHENSFLVDTDAGPHACEVRPDGVMVGMRAPSFEPAALPARSETAMVDAPLSVDGTSFKATALSVGNPHLVIFDDVGKRRLSLGPRLEKDDLFPQGVNVGFAQLRDAVGPPVIELIVWERGVGWTRACGTGACAAVAAAAKTGRVPWGESVEVRLPGGSLHIRARSADDPIEMLGPANHVFSGTVPTPD